MYTRYNRWSHKGHWQSVFEALSTESDFEYLMVDGSIVRVHQDGAQKKIEQKIEAVGKSRGGQSTKIHAACDALGNPVRFILAPGQSSDFCQSNALIEGFNADYVLGDKGYDSNNFVAEIEESGAKPVIPPKKNRIDQREYDSDIYKERNLIERLFQKLKRFRRIASRFERKAKHFLSMLFIASSVIWLKCKRLILYPHVLLS